ncbi:MAG: putative toxin-antitoxin system toxin component, PIN family [Woronichinia naegeliana WA131]|jgi:putative PIN family toxin of toxin-antitoxin system|uniref:Toxin-antitoxin system toxin component, PIN family n=1 Tax=Woronichinia naegeliana WA131 TaxID=2824559 RepID=A0A977KSZ6_9CYAN|nr:MAG: putative toxin-antitoxin system toxin component, PIN family [Woronichinia naegeliana WA131]
MIPKPNLVLDTNIIVSAILSKTGKARQALDKAQDISQVLMSTSVLEEIETVLLRPKFDKYISQLERRFFLTNFLKTVEFIVEKEVIVVCRDPKDDKILNLALSGQAEYIISGDQDLLVLNPFQGIQIITIDTFLKIS